MGKLRAWAVWVVVALSIAFPASPAEIRSFPLGAVDAISIYGEIESGDAQRFKALASDQRHKIVFLNSPGGSLIDGLEIGLFVKDTGAATSIPDGAMCASVCSLIWLAGRTRYFENGSRLGFHAAYSVSPDGEARMSAEANALVGYYVSYIGFAPHVALLVTSALPEEMNWVSPHGLMMNGIAAFSIQAVGNPSLYNPNPWASEPKVVDHGLYSPSLSVTRTIAQDALPEFFETYKEGGMAAAVEASRKCWAAVRSKDDSRLLRYCLTFDIIASETDRVFVQSIPEVEPVEYFMPLQITTRLTAFMNKQGYSPAQVDEMLHAAVASLQ